ncbi:hypothetical protein, partial [Nitratifractor sp.]
MTLNTLFLSTIKIGSRFPSISIQPAFRYYNKERCRCDAFHHPKLCSRKCARCVDARCEGVHSQNVGAPGGCVEALDVSPMPP